MKAVVMAGGEGSRLRPLTSRRPKPLVPVVGLPIMQHILHLLRDHGITQIVVTLQYLGAEIRNFFGDGSDFGVELEYVVEDQPLGTAGSVKNAEHLLRDDTFLVISGDALTDLDVAWAVAEHCRRGARATLVLYSVPTPLEYGVVITDAEGHIQRFLEKPSWGEVFSDHVNSGTYVVDPAVFDLIPAGVSVDWSQDVFPRMLERGDPLFGIVAQGYWCDIGNLQSYFQANWDALEGRVRCRIPGRRNERGVWVGEDVEFGIDVRLDGPAFIGDGAKIKAGAHVNGPAVIDRYSVVDDNAKVSSSIVWQHSYIGEGTRLRQSIICRNVTLKNDVLVEENAVIGDECVVGAGSRIGANLKIWPHKDIQPGSTVNESIIWGGEWKRGLFTSYGVQGLINIELTPEYCARLGAAFAATLPRGATIAVTRDHARSSRMIKRALIAGIVSAGGAVRDLSELPVPVTQFATRSTGCAAGIHVLESPLDRRSADIRFFDSEGLQIDRRTERKVENLFFREDVRRAAFYEMGEIDYDDPLQLYRAHVLRGIDVDAIRNAHLRVLVDYDYSAVSMVLPEILDSLGVATTPLHTGFGASYRPKRPDQFRQAVDEAALIAHTLHLDAGFYLSTSGERCWIIDDAGTTLDPFRAAGVVTSMVLEREPGEVVVPATAPQWLETVVQSHGGRVVVSKSDPASVLRSAHAARAVLATDGDGGFCWPRHLGAYDAVLTIVRVLEMRALSGRPLSAIGSELPVGVYLVRDEPCPWDVKGRVMRVLLERHGGDRLDLSDGIKVHVDGGWVLVLPDPDAPTYHIVASVESERHATALLDDYARQVREAQGVNGSVRAAAVVPAEQP